MLLLYLFFWLKIKNTPPTEIQRSQAQIIFEISLGFFGKYFLFVKKKYLQKFGTATRRLINLSYKLYKYMRPGRVHI